MKIKHCILVKWIDKKIQTKELINSVKEIFNETLRIEGIYKIDVIENVIDRSNRFDLLIEISMEEESLTNYDNSYPHKRWKEEYSSLIDKKAIFDFEI